MMREAPFVMASSIKWCPSTCVPRTAINVSPGYAAGILNERTNSVRLGAGYINGLADMFEFFKGHVIDFISCHPELVSGSVNFKFNPS